jgi:hypothetical protein
MDMRIGIWNVWSLYRTGSLKTAARKLAKFNLDLVAVQKVGLRVVVSQQTVIHFPMEM